MTTAKVLNDLFQGTQRNCIRLQFTQGEKSIVSTINDFDKFNDLCMSAKVKQDTKNLRLFITQVRNLLFIENSKDYDLICTTLQKFDYDKFS